MARLQLLLLPVFAALCLAVAGIARAVSTPEFIVTGRVYCDTCRAGFETPATEYIEGAKVRLECKHFDSGAIEHSVDGVTDKTGTYRIKLENNHEEQICEVVLVESPVAGCSEVDAARNRARVLLAQDSGLASPLRYANPLGYLKAAPLHICGALLQKYALGDDK